MKLWNLMSANRRIRTKDCSISWQTSVKSLCRSFSTLGCLLAALFIVAQSQAQDSSSKKNSFSQAQEYFQVKENAQKAVEAAKSGDSKAAQSASMMRDQKAHPWANGRDLFNSYKDWSRDSELVTGNPFGIFTMLLPPSDIVEGDYTNLTINNFLECFEPRLIAPFCPYCMPPMFRMKKSANSSCFGSSSCSDSSSDTDSGGGSGGYNTGEGGTSSGGGTSGSDNISVSFGKSASTTGSQDTKTFFTKSGGCGSTGSCPYRLNTGEVWEYWWPEWTVDVNNFGISAINPLTFLASTNGKVDAESLFYLSKYTPEYLRTEKNLELKTKLPEHMAELATQLDRSGGTSENVADSLLVGQTHYSGLTAPDQTQYEEAHVYKTKVTTDNHTDGENVTVRRNHGCWDCIYVKVRGVCVPIKFWFNGYKWKNNDRCFYDTIPDARKSYKWIAGYTEQKLYAPYWRFPEFSRLIDQQKYESSSPVNVTFAAGASKSLQLSYLQGETCSSYRAARWPNPYSDLTTAFGIKAKENDQLRDICYVGGGQLYPLVGNLMGHHHPLTSATVIARRAVELMSEIPKKNKTLHQAPRVNRFTDESDQKEQMIDKMQMVYPRLSRCFRMNPGKEEQTPGTTSASGNNSMISFGAAQKVPIVEDIGPEFPVDIIDPMQWGVVKFVVWNRRTACTCPYRSLYEKNKGPCNPMKKCGWGCQIYPDALRGNGNEKPKDKFYGSQKIAFPLNMFYACSAYKLYFALDPFFGQW